MAVRGPATYEEALERISELEEERESLAGLLLVRKRAASDSRGRHALVDVAQEFGAEDVLNR